MVIEQAIDHVLSRTVFTQQDQQIMIGLIYSMYGRMEKPTSCSACLMQRQLDVYNWKESEKKLVNEYAPFDFKLYIDRK